MDINWEVKAENLGWGIITACSAAMIKARFTDGRERWLHYSSVIEARAPKCELRRLKNVVQALLDEGDLPAADRQYKQILFGGFWPPESYRNARLEAELFHCRQVDQYIRGADLAGAEKFRQEKLSSWMDNDRIRELIFAAVADIPSWYEAAPVIEAAILLYPELTKAALQRFAMALDLESDGQQIREIGHACNGQTVLLHDMRQGTDLAAAVTELEARIRAAPLLVGHNLLAWDWPILARHLRGTSPPLIWDTLLIGYLLEPQATSHALGGSHRADQDALDAMLKFQRQLHQVPGIAVDVLSGRIRDFAQLLDAIAEALTDQADFSRPLPNFMPGGSAAPDQLTIMPAHRLRAVDWVPGIRVVSADPERSLAAEWGQIYPPLLRKRLAGVDDPGPNARTLLAVVKLATGQNIPLRRNMIPYWLLDRDDVLTAAVDRACLIPKADGGRRIAPFPERIEAWVKLDPSACVVLGPGDEVLLLDRRALALAEHPPQAGEPRTSNFLRIGSAGPALKWLRVDRAAQMLEPRGGLIEFSTLPVPAAVRTVAKPAPALPWRPKFVQRHSLSLYPHALDQGSYWTDVLLGFRGAVASRPEVVSVLLVTSSDSKTLLDLLATGLGEIGLGESRPEHRSRREHLRRAAARGYALVDTLEQWPALLALAQSANVQLQPVVEALPLEEWYASAETRALAALKDS